MTNGHCYVPVASHEGFVHIRLMPMLATIRGSTKGLIELAICSWLP